MTSCGAREVNFLKVGGNFQPIPPHMCMLGSSVNCPRLDVHASMSLNGQIRMG